MWVSQNCADLVNRCPVDLSLSQDMIHEHIGMESGCFDDRNRNIRMRKWVIGSETSDSDFVSRFFFNKGYRNQKITSYCLYSTSSSGFLEVFHPAQWMNLFCVYT